MITVVTVSLQEVEMSEHEKKFDLIWGGEEIAKIIGRTPRITFSLLEKGELPAKKVGGRWVAERSKLIAFFMQAA